MRYRLKNIASTYSGITIRESIENFGIGKYKLLYKPSDLPKNRTSFDASGLTSIDWRLNSHDQILKHKSIVLFNRGEPVAYLFNGNASDQVLINHTLTIIELNAENVLPEFLVWYINQSDIAKNHFSLNQHGSNMLMTSMSTIQELPVVIPPILDQKGILMREYELSAEKELYTNYLKLKAEFTHAKNHQILTQTMNITKN